MNLIFIIVHTVVVVLCDDLNDLCYDDCFVFENFESVYQWSYVNFTWQSKDEYYSAVARKSYIPENIMLGGIKFYENKIFLALPKHRPGVPVTLTYIFTDESRKTNNLLTPYPNWELNNDSDCFNLQSMLSMEIDTRGIMWAIDGVRLTNNIECPPKLILMDLHSNGKRIHTFNFPNEICLQNGGFLNDIVIDETDGGFAYITDNSNIDPGLIIFSRFKNRAWKIRDKSMYAEELASQFIINQYLFSQLTPIDGIALSPKGLNRTLYYAALSAYSLYAISTNILKNEELCRTNIWRHQVQLMGSKESQTDGMMIDSKGNLYYTLLPLYGVGRWNILNSYEASEVIFTDRKHMIWTDGFGMDQKGYLYVITTRAYSFLDYNFRLKLTPEIKFGIFKTYIGSRSYLYNDVDAHYFH